MARACIGPPDIDTVVCDVGGVIIRFDESVAADIERRHGLDVGTLLPVVLKSEPGRLAMRGVIGREQWLEATSQLVGEDAVLEWLGYHGELDDDVAAQLKAVKNHGIQVVLLSNATDRLWEDLRFHGLDSLADLVLCSADIGRVKPDPGCYLYAAHRGGFRLDQALYIDDTPGWVAAGEAVGMRGHVFQSAEVLGEHLTSVGLLP
jgi:putative hydrolase of the HAD superfamily